jgi:hypothetical protein
MRRVTVSEHQLPPTTTQPPAGRRARHSPITSSIRRSAQIGSKRLTGSTGRPKMYSWGGRTAINRDAHCEQAAKWAPVRRACRGERRPWRYS